MHERGIQDFILNITKSKRIKLGKNPTKKRKKLILASRQIDHSIIFSFHAYLLRSRFEIPKRL